MQDNQENFEVYETFESMPLKENLIIYYINGSVVDEVNLNFNLQLGSQEDEIYIGGSPEYSSEGIVLSKTRWFSKPLTKLEIKNLVNEPYE